MPVSIVDVLKRPARGPSTCQVDYYMYHEEPDDPAQVSIPKDPKIVPEVYPVNAACFYSFCSYMKQKTPKGNFYNRIAYRPKMERQKTIDVERAKQWVKFCVQYGLLPPYVQPEHLDTTFVFKLDPPEFKEKGICPSLIYMYLCNVRHVEEFPEIPNAVLDLVEGGVDPYLAAAVGAKIGCTNSGHNYLNFGYGYFGQPPSAFQISLGAALALKRFVAEPMKYDDRRCSDISHFQCYDRVHSAGNDIPAQYVVRGKDLSDPRVHAMMNAKTTKEVLTLMAELEQEQAAQAAALKQQQEEEAAALKKKKEEELAALKKKQEEEAAAARKVRVEQAIAATAEANDLIAWAQKQVAGMRDPYERPGDDDFVVPAPKKPKAKAKKVA